MTVSFRTILKIALVACFAAMAGSRGDLVTQLSAQQTTRAFDDSAALRALYEDTARFDQLSGAARGLLERRFGKRDVPKEKFVKPNAGSDETESFVNPDDRLSPISQTAVNNVGLDSTAQDTQSESAIVLGAGSVVVSAYNNSRVYDGVTNHFTGQSLSTSSGLNWTDNGALPNSANGDAGDPALARDPISGNLYMSTLCFTGSCVQVFKSTNNGVTWGGPVNGAPGFGGGDFLDKEWIAVDPNNGTIYVVFRNFAGGGGGSLADGIYITKSTDGGTSFGAAVSVAACTSCQGAWVDVDNGNGVYVYWYDSSVTPRRIALRKSTNAAVSFGATVTAAQLAGTGSNGDLGLNGGFRTNSFAQAAVNLANGDQYVVYNDKNGTDKGDIFFVMSNDGGGTFSGALRVNDDATTRDQFMPTIAVTPDGTRLFIAWYDRRRDASNSLIERWGVVGTVTSGFGTNVSFGPTFRISNSSFPVVVNQDPVINSTYMGNYDQAVADNSSFYTTWSDNSASTSTHVNQPDVRFAKVPASGPGAILSYDSSSIATLDVGACNNLTVTVSNLGTATASGVSGVLSTTTAGVIIDQNTSVFPSIAPGHTATNITPYKIRFGGGFVCGKTAAFTLTLSSPFDGTFTYSFTLGTSIILGSAVPFNNNTSTPIPDLATTNIPFTVSGIAGTVGKVTVSLYLTHTYDSDLKISLIGPDSTAVILSNGRGGSADNYGSSCSSRTVFDDAGGTPISAGTAPFVGTFTPEQALRAFSGKTGAGVNGTWNIRIQDQVGGDSGTFLCGTVTITPGTCPPGGSCGVPTSSDIRRASDFDRDGRSDATVFRNGTWFTLNSSNGFGEVATPVGSYSTMQFGQTGDVPVPGDYDGDGQTDYAYYRPSSGFTIALFSSNNNNSALEATWGASNDIPVPGDYDGDHVTDFAVWRPSTGHWRFFKSGSGYAFVDIAWGTAGDLPVPGDYDGDGITDLAIFRPSTREWYVKTSSSNFTNYFSFVWGLASDIAVPADYDGDGITDIAVFRPSTGAWYILTSSSGFASYITYTWGLSTDTPVPGDYDGDGKADLAVFRPSTGQWYILKSSTGYTTFFNFTWGKSGDVPILHRP